MTASELAAHLEARRRQVDASLDASLPREGDWPSTIHRAVRYSLFAGGKRIRPQLVLAAGEAVGGHVDELMPLACAAEMIHTYSLIHDDLPAMDNDDLRRGKPTSHKVFGEAMAILAGDALLTRAFHLLAEVPAGADAETTRRRLAATAVLGEAAGTTGLIGGQVADLEAPGSSPPSEDLVLSIHESKTGRLLRASVVLGGILSFASEEDLALLDRYGRAVGLAFQIKDDLLDVESDAATLGKTAGKDAAAGKATFPGVWGIERSRQMLARTLEEAVTHAQRLARGGGRLPDLARFVGERRS